MRFQHKRKTVSYGFTLHDVVGASKQGASKVAPTMTTLKDADGEDGQALKDADGKELRTGQMVTGR